MAADGFWARLNPVHLKRRTRMEIFHFRIKKIATSSWFTSFIMFIIGINAILIGLETVQHLKASHGKLFVVLDHVFLAIYTLEFFIKVYADSKGYWKSVYNIFDFVILIISFAQIIMDSLDVGDNILGIFRLLRALRTLRTISFIEGLQVLVSALIDTIRNSVLNVVILLALLMLFFGVVGYCIFGYDEDGDKLRWGTLNKAMLTLFAFVTAEGWTDIQKRLEEKYPGSQWFTIVFIFLGHFIFTNLFIGIIIMNIHESTERFLEAQRAEKYTQLKMKKKYLHKRQHDDVQQMLERQKTSKYANFQEMTNGFSQTLRHDDYVIMKDVCTNLVWLETYLESLDYLDLYMYRVQQAHRNLAVILAEVSERHYKKQHGFVLADDLFPNNTKLLPPKPDNPHVEGEVDSSQLANSSRNKMLDVSNTIGVLKKMEGVGKIDMTKKTEDPRETEVHKKVEDKENSKKMSVPRNMDVAKDVDVPRMKNPISLPPVVLVDHPSDMSISLSTPYASSVPSFPRVISVKGNSILQAPVHDPIDVIKEEEEEDEQNCETNCDNEGSNTGDRFTAAPTEDSVDTEMSTDGSIRNPLGAAETETPLNGSTRSSMGQGDATGTSTGPVDWELSSDGSASYVELVDKETQSYCYSFSSSDLVEDETAQWDI